MSVGGTPGIDKTIFGLFLLRHFVEKDRSVVYWDGEQATIFTKDPKYIELFGLSNMCHLKEDDWFWGAWTPRYEELCELLDYADIYVVHDPAPDFLLGGKNPTSKIWF